MFCPVSLVSCCTVLFPLSAAVLSCLPGQLLYCPVSLVSCCTVLSPLSAPVLPCLPCQLLYCPVSLVSCCTALSPCQLLYTVVTYIVSWCTLFTQQRTTMIPLSVPCFKYVLLSLVSKNFNVILTSCKLMPLLSAYFLTLISCNLMTYFPAFCLTLISC